jgi:2-amino-4-hydroxy-6-hydroxymethyldihydropteridine diphosphokinase
MSASREPVLAVVGLGANLGEATRAVRSALEALGALPETTLESASRLYRTAPHQAQGPDYINAVACLRTRLTAPALFDQLLRLEQAAGRERPWHHAPRTLDLDLLFYGDGRIESPRLVVPHPRWDQRAFVLVPLAEVWPDRVSAHQIEAVRHQPITPA